MHLIDHARNEHSQNGEDGIIQRVFEVIGTRSRECCEFGAWDGVRFSNTRSLLLSGWMGCLIECDPARFRALSTTYAWSPAVKCVCSKVESSSGLSIILREAGLGVDLDLLSIDIDGPDYTIFEALQERPRVVVVEVNAGLSPEADLLPGHVAAHNIGQPLCCFQKAAHRLGYRLVCYTGNAFFIREDCGHDVELPTLTPVEAYRQFLSRLPLSGRRWLHLVNLGLVAPRYRFDNPYLSPQSLALGGSQCCRARLEAAYYRGRSCLRRLLR